MRQGTYALKAKFLATIASVTQVSGSNSSNVLLNPLDTRQVSQPFKAAWHWEASSEFGASWGFKFPPNKPKRWHESSGCSHSIGWCWWTSSCKCRLYEDHSDPSMVGVQSMERWITDKVREFKQFVLEKESRFWKLMKSCFFLVVPYIDKRLNSTKDKYWEENTSISSKIKPRQLIKRPTLKGKKKTHTNNINQKSNKRKGHLPPI